MKKIILSITVFLIVAGALTIVSFGTKEKQKSFKTYEALASEIIETCSEEEYRPTCYEKEVPKVMDEGLSMEEAFEVTRIIQGQDDAYLYCHVLGHNLSAKETSKDPSKWKDVVIRVPSGICSNGGIHGAFQEKFRAESLPDTPVEDLKQELEGICEARKGWDPTLLEEATCTHALGHLTMYITDASVNKSLELCDVLASDIGGRDMSGLCYDGAFMQIFQPLEPDDFALIAGKEIETQEAASEFCSNFSGQSRSSCVSESWPLFLEKISTPEGLIDHCSVLSNDPVEEVGCYTDLFYVLTALNGLDENWIEGYCSAFSQGQIKGKCFANAASRIIEVDWGNIDRAISVCTLAEAHDVGAACYEEMVLYSDYNFHYGSEEFYKICNGLPEPWSTKCLSK